MTLYEIDKSLMELIDLESGEVTDVDAFDQLEMAREQKIENIGHYIKNLKAEQTAIDGEIQNFKDRKEANKKTIERLEGLLRYATGGEKFQTATVSISFRKSESINIVDEFLIPECYVKETVKVTKAPDKTEIKKAIKEGKEVAGAVLEQKLNVTVK